MTDLDAIRASRAACADLPWSCPCVSGEQLDALVEELERLRGERAAVVAWLQAEMNYMLASDGGPMHMRGLIECIERGDHRREEE